MTNLCPCEAARHSHPTTHVFAQPFQIVAEIEPIRFPFLAAVALGLQQSVSTFLHCWIEELTSVANLRVFPFDRCLMGTSFSGFFVTNLLLLHQNSVALAIANPLAGPDQEVAGWFHAHLTRTFVSVLRAFTDFGSGEWIGVILFALVLFFVWKRWWPSLVTLIVAVPGGMLLNEWVKVLVHRQRPFVDGPFVDWSGYSFASGHTIGATLLYGQLLLFILPALKARHWRLISIFSAVLLVVLVGFSRIALGAHFLTDVLAAIFFGAVWLTFCLIAGKSIGKHRRYQPSPLPISSELISLAAEQPAQSIQVSRAN
jgi:membrane-associated phospholipid phosphatase